MAQKPKVWACIPSARFRVKTFEPLRALKGFRVLTLNGSGLRFLHTRHSLMDFKV